MKTRLLLILCTALLTACQSRQSGIPSEADTLTMRYAQYLTLIAHADYTEVQIRNPWNESKLLQRFTIGDKPYERAAIFTTTHSSLIEELGCIDAIAGICETEYIANPRLLSALSQGHISDIGSAMTPNREHIVSLTPDAILLSPYENASTYGNLESLGIPIIQCAD